MFQLEHSAHFQRIDTPARSSLSNLSAYFRLCLSPALGIQRECLAETKHFSSDSSQDCDIGPVE